MPWILETALRILFSHPSQSMCTKSSTIYIYIKPNKIILNTKKKKKELINYMHVELTKKHLRTWHCINQSWQSANQTCWEFWWLAPADEMCFLHQNIRSGLTKLYICLVVFVEHDGSQSEYILDSFFLAVNCILQKHFIHTLLI